MNDEPALRPTPIPGAGPETPHPLRRAWRGLAELAAVSGQALLALSELIRPRRDDTEPRPPHRHGGLHPVEKGASYPIND